jgi:hypothetical protein
MCDATAGPCLPIKWIHLPNQPPLFPDPKKWGWEQAAYYDILVLLGVGIVW